MANFIKIKLALKAGQLNHSASQLPSTVAGTKSEVGCRIRPGPLPMDIGCADSYVVRSGVELPRFEQLRMGSYGQQER